MAVSPQKARRLISLLFWQFVGAVVGVGVSGLLWLQRATRKMEQLPELIVIVIAVSIAVFWALRKEPRVRVRVLTFSLIGAVTAWLLAATSSATFDQRVERLFSDPFLAFRPLSFACSAVAGGLFGYFLPTLRQWLMTFNPGHRSEL